MELRNQRKEPLSTSVSVREEKRGGRIQPAPFLMTFGACYCERELTAAGRYGAPTLHEQRPLFCKLQKVPPLR